MKKQENELIDKGMHRRERFGQKTGTHFLGPDFSLEKTEKHNQGECICGASNAKSIKRTGASSSQSRQNESVLRKASERSLGQDVHGGECRKRQPLFPRRCKTMCAVSRHPMSRWHSAPNAGTGRRCCGCPRRNAVMQPKHGLSANTADAAN